MSNSLAISAVTATLQRIIADGLQNNLPPVIPPGFSTAGVKVTSQPPEKPVGAEIKHINIFLYNTELNPAFRNQGMPGRVKSGEPGIPPLALNLYYLITAYGRDSNDDDLYSQFLLCNAMHTLHDHTLLDPVEIKAALIGNDLHEQIERVRITPHALSLDDIYKLWSTFQAPARTSAAYMVSVVLIESRRPVKAPLPVITRGEEDKGVDVLAALPPTIDKLIMPDGLPALRLGDEFKIRGQRLKDDNVRVEIKSKRSDEIFAPESLVKITDAEIIAKLPAPGDITDPNSAAAKWPVGQYELAVVVSSIGGKERLSEIISFSLAPSITVAPNAAAAGDIDVTVTCAQNILPDQDVSLLFGSREIKVPSSAHTAATNTLIVEVTDAQAADDPYVVRLRVDGVDSIPVEPGVKPPQFAANQKVKVT